MFLQLATVFFAVQWIGSPWQLGVWKAILASIFFLLMIVISIIPAFFREYGNFKKYQLVFAVLEIIFCVLQFILPGIGHVLLAINTIILLFFDVQFYKYIGSGLIIFSFWFAGINHLLGNFFLEDPRGVWSGDLYFNLTDWVILGVFIVALVRTIYHICLSYPNFRKYNDPDYDISYIMKIRNLAITSSLGLNNRLKLENRLPTSHEKKEILRKVFDQVKKDNITPVIEYMKKDIEDTIKSLPQDIIDSAKTTVLSANDSMIESGKTVVINSIKSLDDSEKLKDNTDALIAEAKDTVSKLPNDIINSGITTIENAEKSIDDIINKAQEQISNNFNKNFGGAIRLLLSNTQAANEYHKKKEKRTLIPIFVISLIAFVASTFISLPWEQEAVDDLKMAFFAINENDYETAKFIAAKYYNDEQILHIGDMFYLKGLIEETDEPQNAIQYYRSAAAWYKNHNSWISQNYRMDSLFRLANIYFNDTPPDYYRARNTIRKLIKLESLNEEYLSLQTSINEALTIYEKENKIRFYRRWWNRFRAQFN